MKYNSNIERQLHAGASKEEKARHNGVDTSRWGNDCPRIAVPAGWEDHQHTQQLIRKYITNDFAMLNFKNKQLIVILTDEEREAVSCYDYNMENGVWKSIRKYLYLNQTALGLCIEVRIRKDEDREPMPEKGMVGRESYDFGWAVKDFPMISYISVRNPQNDDIKDLICNIINNSK